MKIMVISDFGLTPSDFRMAAWEAVVARSQIHMCEIYEQLFRNHAKIARQEGNETRARVYEFLEAVASLQLSNPEDDQPFTPLIDLPGKRSAVPEDFDDSALALLEAVAEDFKGKDHDLYARMADLLVVRRSTYKLVTEAVEAYLNAIMPLQDRGDWLLVAWARLCRAEALSWKRNSKKGKMAVLKFIEDAIAHCHATALDAEWAYSLMCLLLKRKASEPARYALLAAIFAQDYLTQRAWDDARLFWEVEAKWHVKNGDAKAAREARLRLAKSFFDQATEAAKDGSDVADIRAANWIMEAILHMRMLSPHSETELEEMEEYHRCMLAHQKRGAEAFGNFPLTELQVGETVKKLGAAMTQLAVAKATGKPFRDALYELANTHTMNVRQVREQVKGQSGFVFSRLLGAKRFDTNGRIIAERGPLSDNPEEHELRSAMCDLAVRLQAHIVACVIEPVRHVIAEEHYISEANLFEIVRECPLITAGQSPLWTSGLHAGLCGDFTLAAHLLAPRFEDFIRRILILNGAIGPLSDGQEAETTQSLHVLLHGQNTYTALEDILGEDTAFDLFSILIGRFGDNLRNMLEHGLLHQDVICYGSSSVYLWWLALKICLTTRFDKTEAVKEAEATFPDTRSGLKKA
jgi:hypothetical protein